MPELPGYAASLAASATPVGLFMASFGITGLVVSLPAAWIADRTSLHRLPICQSSHHRICGGALRLQRGGIPPCTGNGLVGPGPVAQPGDLPAADEQAAAIGLVRTLGGRWGALAPPPLGAVADLGGYRPPLIFSAAILLRAGTTFGWVATGVRAVPGSAGRSTGDPADG